MGSYFGPHRESWVCRVKLQKPLTFKLLAVNSFVRCSSLDGRPPGFGIDSGRFGVELVGHWLSYSLPPHFLHRPCTLLPPWTSCWFLSCCILGLPPWTFPSAACAWTLALCQAFLQACFLAPSWLRACPGLRTPPWVVLVWFLGSGTLRFRL